jgi:hypothetical protein
VRLGGDVLLLLLLLAVGHDVSMEGAMYFMADAT